MYILLNSQNLTLLLTLKSNAENRIFFDVCLSVCLSASHPTLISWTVELKGRLFYLIFFAYLNGLIDLNCIARQNLFKTFFDAIFLLKKGASRKDKDLTRVFNVAATLTCFLEQKSCSTLKTGAWSGGVSGVIDVRFLFLKFDTKFWQQFGGQCAWLFYTFLLLHKSQKIFR